jgi:predicted transposase YdaD
MGLRYPVDQVNQFIKGLSAMLFGIHGIEESSVYQDILQKGEALGEAKGRVEAARNILLRMGRKKFGPPPELLAADLASIDDPDRLTDLAHRIFDVSSWTELLEPAN